MVFLFQVSATNFYVSHSSISTNWGAALCINTPCDVITAFMNADDSKGYFLSESDNHEIYHNIFSNQEWVNISIENEDGDCTDGMRIFNNTFYRGNKKGVSISLGCGTGQNFYKKIFYGLKINTDVVLQRWFCKDNNEKRVAAGVKIELEVELADHYQFGDFPSNLSIRFRRPDSSFVSYSKLASWQDLNELIDIGHAGEGNLISNTIFVNASGTMSETVDFALQINSPCKATGRNGEDMGANFSLVGIRGTLAADINAPTLPTNLAGTAASQTAINLTWSESTNGLEGYRVYRNGTLINISATKRA